MLVRSFAAAVLLASATQAQQVTGREVRHRISDSLTLVGDLYRASAPDTSPAIIVFHQGGSNVDFDYKPIIPRLIAEGFHVLAVDARGGGERNGGKFRGPVAGSAFRYCDAIAEVKGAISMARVHGFSGRVILWGSSYTGALVIQAAAKHPRDVRAVLAFSPASGDPLRECPDESFVPQLRSAGISLMVVRPSAENVEPERQARLARFKSLGATTFVANGNGHGSSVLVADRTGGDTAPVWQAVIAFLREARGH